jgi:tRNA-splicing endonuclease subunit Sen54
MHAALQGGRVHQPKNHILGHLDVESGTVLVRNARGQHFRTMGKGERAGVRLLPEEALYLLERGSLDLRWEADGGEHAGPAGAELEKEENAADDTDNGIPLSLQAAYAFLIGKRGLTLDRYVVYAGLKRCGFAVIRAPGWEGQDAVHALTADISQSGDAWSFFSALFGRLSMSRDPPPLGPLVRPGLYRNYRSLPSIAWRTELTCSRGHLPPSGPHSVPQSLFSSNPIISVSPATPSCPLSCL